MFFFGRLIGGLVGWLLGSWLGALLGLVVGFYFDRGLKQFQRSMDPEARRKIEQALFNTVFPLLGKMAKADGRVSEEEIHVAEQMMAKMQLDELSRKEAIRLFQSGVQDNYSVENAVAEFMNVARDYPDIKQLLLVYLITLAMADGDLHAGEADVLKLVSRGMGYPENAFEHILQMAKAQGFFRGGAGSQINPQEQIDLAYQALGVSPSIDDAQLKRTYRKLMSQYHPDKLSGQGASEDMIQVATERSQEIQAAYDLIRKTRASQR